MDRNTKSMLALLLVVLVALWAVFVGTLAGGVSITGNETAVTGTVTGIRIDGDERIAEVTTNDSKRDFWVRGDGGRDQKTYLRGCLTGKIGAAVTMQVTEYRQLGGQGQAVLSVLGCNDMPPWINVNLAIAFVVVAFSMLVGIATLLVVALLFSETPTTR